jgi:hypothetical protein
MNWKKNPPAKKMRALEMIEKLSNGDKHVKLPTIPLPMTSIRNIVLKVLLRQNVNFDAAYRFIYEKCRSGRNEDITSVKKGIEDALSIFKHSQQNLHHPLIQEQLNNLFMYYNRVQQVEELKMDGLLHHYDLI